MQPHLTLFSLYADLPPRSNLLLCQLDDPDFIASLAQQHELTLLHRDHSALERLRALFAHHPSISIRDDVFPPPDPVFDAALLQAPKSRGLARACLYTCLRAVKHDRHLYAVGPNNAGAKTAESDAARLGPTETLGTKARHRLFITSRGLADPPAPPEWDAPWEPRRVPMTVAGRTYEITTQPGIFSWDHPDDGTLLLIDHFGVIGSAPHPRVLDAACGHGLLGMAAESILGAADVTFVDIDLLAVRCLRRTRPEAEVVAHDLTHAPLPGAPQFDLILCNPPFHQEHARDLSFMNAFPRHARAMLAPGGRLAIVANSFLPYARHLDRHFGRVTKLADNRRFQILLATA